MRLLLFDVLVASGCEACGLIRGMEWRNAGSMHMICVEPFADGGLRRDPV